MATENRYVTSGPGTYKSILRWAWTQHGKYQERFKLAMESPAFAHITFVRLSSRDEVDRWVRDLTE